MSERSSEIREPLDYEYYYDGIIRRQLHEFGALGVNFYYHSIDRMGCRPGDIVLESGAGMGHDGRDIAWHYRPKIVYLLEPVRGSPDEFDNRFYGIEYELRAKKIKGVEVLPSSQLASTVYEMSNPNSQILLPRTTYLQPTPGTAEEVPLPDNSVTKYSSIHSIYEWHDIQKALQEAARVMTPDASGLVITNGPDDKPVFKEILEDSRQELDADAPDGVKYTAPHTVSSRVDYNLAESLLKQYFEVVQLITYKDTMIITPDRAPLYEYAYNSYKRGFFPPVINQGRWSAVRQKVLIERMKKEINEKGYFKDEIDIGAIFFSRPKK